MIFDAYDYAEEKKAPLGQRMRAEPHWGGSGEDPDADEFVRMEVLGDPAARAAVVVMYGVDVAVEEPDLVVDEMPDVVLEVEDDQCRILLPTEFPQARSDQWQRSGRSPDPLGDRNR